MFVSVVRCEVNFLFMQWSLFTILSLQYIYFYKSIWKY